MSESLLNLLNEHGAGIFHAFLQSNFLLFGSALLMLPPALGTGILLFYFHKADFKYRKALHNILSFVLNGIRSIPFLILIFLLLPPARFLFGSGLGNAAALLPLTLVGISLYSRFTEQALTALPEALLLRARSMGATFIQSLLYFYLPAAYPDLCLSFCSCLISLLAYSTVLGVIGSGGLGEYAFRYAYQEYNYPLLYLISFIFIFYVYCLQKIFYRLAGTNSRR